MTITAGISPLAGEAPTDVEHPSRIGRWRVAADLQVGWHVRLPDGRLATVLELPVLVSLGRVSVEVAWNGYHEAVLWAALRRVWTRTVGEQAAYLDAVEVDAAIAAITREGNHG